MPDGVVQQVVQGLPQVELVPHHQDGRTAEYGRDVLLLGLDSGVLNGVPEQLLQLELGEVELDLSVLQPGDEEEVVHHPLQVAQLFGGQSQVFLAGGCQIAPLVRQEVQIALDDKEGAAEVVDDVGHEALAFLLGVQQLLVCVGQHLGALGHTLLQLSGEDIRLGEFSGELLAGHHREEPGWGPVVRTGRA